MFRVLKITTHREPKFDKHPEIENVGKRKARYQSVMRVLKPNTVYEFFNHERNLPVDFFTESLPHVSISAIVGENGMGKSSLLELMLRIVNNAAYAMRGGLDRRSSYHPRYVRDVYATLTFEDIDDRGRQRKHEIVVDDKIIRFVTDDETIWTYDFDNRDGDNKGVTYLQERLSARDCMEQLFYTVVVNYSMYSYNVNEYTDENTEPDELDSDDNREEMIIEDYCWLNSVFHKNDGYQFPLVLNPFRSDGVIDVNNERILTQNRVFLMAIAEESPLSNILQDKEPYSFRFDVNSNYDPIYNSKYGCRNGRYQMQYLRLIADWKEENDIIDILGETILKIWSKCIGYDLLAEVDCRNKQFDKADRIRALNYVVYKTIKIALTYGKYKKYQDFLRDAGQKGKDGNIMLQVYIKLLHDDNTHVTLKLFRALAFLVFGHYGTTIRHTHDEEYVGRNELYLKDFGKRIDGCLNREPCFWGRSDSLPTMERYDDLGECHEWRREELLPASCFDAKMWLKVKTTNGRQGKFVSISSLSSGERQLIYMLCTAMYHLFNLKTNWQNGNEKDPSVKYQNVFMVFDEMELYFHPKYQTMLVERLLRCIKSMGLENTIKGIHIMFSTHSPFILSDIPMQNIVGISKGKPAGLKNIKDTFCANVYDILASGFFMKRFVGEFAERKLDETLLSLTKNTRADEEEFEKAEIITQLVGDDYIRINMEHMLSSIKDGQNKKEE